LKDLKESYPVDLADYPINNGIQDEPALACWVPFMVRKRKAIIQKIKSKYWQKTHKYGIEIPRTMEDAKRIDDAAKDGLNLWQKAIKEEMTNNCVAF